MFDDLKEELQKRLEPVEQEEIIGKWAGSIRVSSICTSMKNCEAPELLKTNFSSATRWSVTVML